MNYPELERCIDVVKKLRHPTEGCSWDLKQTYETLLPYLIEESYEFIHATNQKDPKAMEEELGDVLLQILLHSTIAEQKKDFNIESVAKTLANKLIERHPHVFKNNNAKELSPDQVVENWQKIKAAEKAGMAPTLIEEKVLHYPALMSADKIGKKTHDIKFDWDDAAQVAYKVEEEWQELKDELNSLSKNKAAIEEELGDLLFSVAQLARHLKIDSEIALQKANAKFLKRFHLMEKLIIEDKKDISRMNQAQMDVYWAHAKKL
jgi:MazG family protein